MAYGKAAGPDELPIELLKSSPPNIKNIVLKIINRAWNEGQIPQDWGKSIICPIHKKGDRNICSNYRGISLMPHICKLYERILVKKVREKIEPVMEEWQHAYRKNRGTSDLIFAIRQITEKAWEFDQQLFIALIDLSKAFDSVPRGNLWRVMQLEYHITGKLLKAIMSTYDPCKCKVMTGHRNESWFDVTTGVKQGSILSPILFIAYLDSILKKVNRGETEKMKTLGYADDICHWERSVDDIQMKMNRYDQAFGEAGMRMNKEKTEIISFGRDRTQIQVRVGDATIKQVDEAKYLGVTISREAGNKLEITDRIARFSRQAGLLGPILRSRHVSRTVKKTIYTTILRPILLYGSESWVLTTADISRLEAAEMKVIRTIMGKTRRDRVRSEQLRRELEVTPLIKELQRSSLGWLGHIQRMDAGRIPKVAFEWRPDGRRPAGRPRKRWTDGIQETLTQYRMGRLDRLVENGVFHDRAEWKRRCSHLTGH